MAFHSLELDLSHILLFFFNMYLKSITYFESRFVGSLVLVITCRFLINAVTVVMNLPYATWIMINAHCWALWSLVLFDPV